MDWGLPMAQVKVHSGKSIVSHKSVIEATSESLKASNSSAERSESKGKFSNSNFLKGNVRIAGGVMHVEYLWLMLFEFLACILTWMFTISRNTVDSSVFLNSLTFSLLGVLSMLAMGLYDNRQRNRYIGVFTRIVTAHILSAFFISVIMYSHFGVAIDYLPVTLSLIFLVMLFSATRAIFERYVDGCVLRKRILVLGTGSRATTIEKLRRKSDRRGFELLGFVASKGCQNCYVTPDRLIAVGDVCQYSLNNHVDEIVVALDDRRHGLPTEQLLDCRMSGIEITEDLDFFERESGLIQLDLIKSSWLIHTKGFSNNYLRYLEKRGLDIIGSMILGVISSPFMLLTAIAIKFECGLRSPVFYTQKRVGRDGDLFTIYKFRSMCFDAENQGEVQWASANDQRVTKVGRVIRKYRLDELPQLWNILIGDMSLVGPRPERPEFVRSLDELNPFYNDRHRVAPGLTGWAQLSYPYGASNEDSIEKLKYDLYYIKNQGFFLDLYILLQTAEVVLFKKGAR
jgi:sugar transferase (PEP-CTERM system associated)